LPYDPKDIITYRATKMPQDQIRKASGNLSLIPQIFYDIIARVVPGVTVLLVAYLVYSGAAISANTLRNVLHWFSSVDSPNTFVFLTFMLASYVLSTVIGQIASLLELPFKSSFQHQFDQAAQKVADDFNKTFSLGISKDVFPSIAIMYDYIRLHDPGSGSRLVKLRAESHMCRNLAVGLVMVVILDFILDFAVRGPSERTGSLWIRIAVLTAVVCFLWTYARRRGFYIWGLCNHWVLLRCRDRLGNISDQPPNTYKASVCQGQKGSLTGF
jgi:hypothetical protein